ncbi:MAG: cysteine desulfurase family protein, partial [Patescibacteria group bacterium]
MRNIYLDNAAASPIDPRVQEEVDRGMKICGNPSSFNDSGRKAANELTKARLKVARFLGAHPEEIVFTGSGSEANNLAIQGAVNSDQETLITTPIEHPSVLEPIKKLEKEGYKVRYLPVDRYGFVDSKSVQNMLTAHCSLVSVMYANNEIGTIEPINKIGKVIKEFKTKNYKLKTINFPLFHVDACQAAGCLNMNVNNLQADLITFNGSKIGGPRGIGVLYVRRGINLNPFILGGGQERGLRAGTENLPAILGMAKAIELVSRKESAKLTKLRDYFIGKLKVILPEIKINGPAHELRLPNNINISIPDLDSENLLLELDKYGIYAGSGSACTSRAVEPSHVL